MSHDISDNEADRMSLSDTDKPEGHEEPEDENNKENSGAEDGEGRRIDPSTSKKKITRRTIPKLNPARLKGPKGVITIEKYFEGFKFHGKGQEKADLDRVMKRLEHWAHRLFPKYQFDDFLEKTEALGSKKEIHTYLTKYRKDMLTDEPIMEEDNADVEGEREKSPEPADEFDMLIAEQIVKTKHATSSQFSQLNSATRDEVDEEVRKRIEINRQIALERRLAKMREREKINQSSVAAEKGGEETGVNVSQVDELISHTIEETQSLNISQQNQQETAPAAKEINNEEEEIKKRIEKNRQMAVERRLARMKQKEMESCQKSELMSQENLKLSSRQEGFKENDEEMIIVCEEKRNNSGDRIVDDEKSCKIVEKVPGDEAEGENSMEVDEENMTQEKKKKKVAADEGEFNSSRITNVSSSVSNKTNVSSKKLLTDEELDKEIGAAVDMFIKSKRSSLL